MPHLQNGNFPLPELHSEHLIVSFISDYPFWSLDPAVFHCDYYQSICNDILLQLNQIVSCHLL